MKTFVFLRFGPAIPIPQVTEGLNPHMVKGQAIAFPMPGGVMSVFNSESDVVSIMESVKESAPGIPFIVFPFEDGAYGLPDQAIDAMEALDAATNGREPGKAQPAENVEPTTELTVDQILDKLNEHGIESLTPAELRILNNQ